MKLFIFTMLQQRKLVLSTATGLSPFDFTGFDTAVVRYLLLYLSIHTHSLSATYSHRSPRVATQSFHSHLPTFFHGRATRYFARCRIKLHASLSFPVYFIATWFIRGLLLISCCKSDIAGYLIDTGHFDIEVRRTYVLILIAYRFCYDSPPIATYVWYRP